MNVIYLMQFNNAEDWELFINSDNSKHAEDSKLYKLLMPNLSL